MEKLFACVDARLQEHKQLLEEIVNINSYTADKADVDKVGAYITAFAEKQGFHVETVPFEKAGNGLLITWNEDAPLPPRCLYGPSGHGVSRWDVQRTTVPGGGRPILRPRRGGYEGRSGRRPAGHVRAEGRWL